jgi:hypothetical protein
MQISRPQKNKAKKSIPATKNAKISFSEFYLGTPS